MVTLVMSGNGVSLIQLPYIENIGGVSSLPTLPTLPKIEIKTVDIPKNKVLKSSEPKSDREIQFYEAEECKNIKPSCSKDDVLAWIKINPNGFTNFKEMYEKLGIGCFEFRNQLKKEGLI